MNDFDLQARLSGDLVELRPLCPDDWEDLFACSFRPANLEQHPAFNRYKEEIFKEFFRQPLESGGAFVILDRQIVPRPICSARSHVGGCP
jgi:N-acetyltransferase